MIARTKTANHYPLKDSLKYIIHLQMERPQSYAVNKIIKLHNKSNLCNKKWKIAGTCQREHEKWRNRAFTTRKFIGTANTAVCAL